MEQVSNTCITSNNGIAKMTSKSSLIKDSQNSFIKPSTKLEDIELALNTPNPDQNVSSSQTQNPLNNTIYFVDKSEQKILSLQRSISEKLRNSFKNTTNNLNTNAQLKSFLIPALASPSLCSTSTSTSSANSTTRQIWPRKWHSEKHRNNINKVNSNAARPPSLRYSTQVPLNSHYKAILDQYTNKNKTVMSNIKKCVANKTFKTQQPLAAANKKSNMQASTEFVLFPAARLQTLRKNLGQVPKANRSFSRVAFKKKTKPNVNNNSTEISSTRKDELSKQFFFNFDNEDEDDDDDDEEDDVHHIIDADFLKYKAYMKKNKATNENAACSSDDSDTDTEKDLPKYDTGHIHDDEDDDDEEDDDDNDENLYKLTPRSKYLMRSHSFSIGDTNLLFTHINDLDNIDLLAETESNVSSLENNYERVTSEKHDCHICFENEYVNERACCGFRACNKCINMYIKTQIKECCGNVRIECLNSKCNKLIHRNEITERMSRYDKDSLKTYLKFLVDANKDSNCKTCPRCSHILRLDEYRNNLVNLASSGESGEADASKAKSTKKTSKKKSAANNNSSFTKVQCNECLLIWCFQCHAPYHDGITCNEFKKGDKMLKYWAKEVHYGQCNAQVCPKCNIYIQRNKGCDHMVCTYCLTEFCYKCGCKFRRFKFIGDHYSKLSVLGCKYRFYPDKPVKRKVIRGSVLGAKLLATPFIASAGVIVGVGAIAVGCVVLPIYGTYKLAKHIKASYQKKSYGKYSLKTNEGDSYRSQAQMLSFKKRENLPEPQQSSSCSMFENTNNSSLATVSTTSKIANDLHLVPREASQNQKLINMINGGIDKFNSNNNNSSENKLNSQVDSNNNHENCTNKNLDSVKAKN